MKDKLMQVNIFKTTFITSKYIIIHSFISLKIPLERGQYYHRHLLVVVET